MSDKNLRKWVKYMTVGSTFAISLAGMAIGGYLFGKFLDSRFGTHPALTILLMLVGVILGVVYLIVTITKLEKSKNE